MNEFYTEYFTFYVFDPTDEEHHDFIAQMQEDELITNAFPDILAHLGTDTGDELNNAYLVANEYEELVGFIKLVRDSKSLAGVEIHSAVAKEARTNLATGQIRDRSQETVGCQILREASNYLLEQYDYIKFIKLWIRTGNIRSVNSALHAGFKLDGPDPKEYIKNEPTEYDPNPAGLIRGR